MKFELFRPPADRLPPAGQRMLVVVLHGCTQDAGDIARGTRFSDAAARDGFLVLYPEQDGSAHPQRCWNWYLPDETRRGSGEIGALGELTERIACDEAVAQTRVFLTGISAGAAMAANLAVAYPELFAAVAMHSGLAAGAANNMVDALAAMRDGVREPESLGAAAVEAMGPRARPIPLLAIHGRHDAVVSPRNLDGVLRQWATTSALAAGADPSQVTRSGILAPDARLSGEQMASSDGRVLAEGWLVEGLGHAWSGGSPDGSFTNPDTPSATAVILDFFRRVSAR